MVISHRGLTAEQRTIILSALEIHGRYTTIAGLVLYRLGDIPSTPGARVRLATWGIEVVEIDRHAITVVRLRPHVDLADDNSPPDHDSNGGATGQEDSG
ncbi:transporter associated domain-containing protein [Streptomyces sp. NPDC003032]